MSNIKEIIELDKILDFLWGDYHNITEENLINKDSLERLGYFNHFGHQLCGPGYLSNSDVLSASSSGRFNGKTLDGGDVFFVPAACLNLYEPLFNESKGINFTVLTSLTQVYRKEVFYDSYRRMNFWVREFVLFGKRNEIDQCIEGITSRFLHSLSILKGTVTLQPATDSFVPNRFRHLLSDRQKQENAKLEFISSEANVSFGSINYHKQHFIKNFGLEEEGFETACIGIGLTRLNKLIKENIIEVSNGNRN
ncbi:hypothetical protein [Pectobacterium sp. B2J-2]|uniref:hypothetical protein n=1 Tax=Pectobacterium sp. B2J-2 TaxID=3385372 RepID=UPI0038FC5141